MIGESSMDNPTKRVLITGETGFVGYRLFEYLKLNTNWEIIGISKSPGKYVDSIVDLSNIDRVKNFQKDNPFDVIIHTASISKTDVCENDKENCYAANVISTKNLISAFDSAKFVYFSTYAVYNTLDGKCKESTPVFPTNYYIETKILGEKIVKVSPHAIIFRPSVIFGYIPFERSSKNYFMQLLYNIKNKLVIQSPIDQFFNPIHVDVVSDIVICSIEKDVNGTFNLGSNEEISKFDFNKKIIDRYNFDEQYLEGINSTSLAVIRPNNGTISSCHIQETLGWTIPDLDQMIEKLYQSTREYPKIVE
jgi:dTDP-4-dehydrorhamnose reductase